MNRIKSVIHKHRYATAAFFLPVLITILAFAATGIYPFGPNQITVIDMYHQYVPFLSELQYKLHHGGSLFYSWDGAGGFNFWNLLAYYGASPLNLLLILFPEKLIVEGVTVLLLIKIGLAGCFMYLFLTDRYGKDAQVWLHSVSAGAWSRVAFGSLYALSAYTCAYFWCIMWLDVVALLPLIIMGLTRLVEKGRGAFYAITLGLACFCNYYIALMVCIFIVLYYLMLYFSKPREGGDVQFLLTTGKVALYSVIGAVLAAPMLVPTYISMKNTYYTPTSMPDSWLFYNNPLEIVNQLLPLAHLSFREGLPNIGCGLLVCMMLAFYFLCRTIPTREKVAHGCLLAVMFFSLNLNGLDFMWHGFHFPNELPFRYSFVICFLLVSMACRAMSRLPQLRKNVIWAIFAAGLGYYLLASKLMAEAVDDPDPFFYIGVVLLALYTTLLMVYCKGWLGARGTVLLILLVVSAELLSTVTLDYKQVGNVEREPYLEYQQDINALVQPREDEFARTELYEWSIMNTPALYHYRGLSQFSSSLNANATELMEKIGLEGEPGKNRYNYVVSDPVTNAILNLKYIISTEEPMEDEHFSQIDQSGDCILYENEYPLSVGYMLPNSIRTWDMISTNPFAVLNDYVRAATDNKVNGVFSEVGKPETDTFGVSVAEDSDCIWTVYEEGEGKEDGAVQLTYTAKQEGNHYVYVEADNAETVDVIYEDGSIRSLREDSGAVVNVGALAKGEELIVEVDYGEEPGTSIRCHFCTMDEDLWNEAYGMISKETMTVTDFGDTFIEGTVKTSKGGMFTTSVLNEEGWTLKVDGQKRPIEELVGGDFIATPLSAGEHIIRLSFRPPGLIPGCILMIIGILLLIGLVQLRHRRIRSVSSFSISDKGI